jgi:hypothetical protein
LEPLQPTGDGSEASPYSITNLNNLLWLSLNPSEWDKHYIQSNNIDAASTQTWYEGEGFPPIGNGSTPFTGTYNGQGNTIGSLYINRTIDNVGLFGAIQSANIKRVILSDVDITGNNQVGGLVGNASNSSISHSSSIGNSDISGGGNVGGLVGNLDGSDPNNISSLHMCSTTGTVNGSNSNSGGLAGRAYTYTYVGNSYSHANVTGNDNVGGLLGRIYGLAYQYINSSYATGTVSGAWGTGGLIGYGNNTSSNVRASFWDIETSGQTESAGGTGKTSNELKDATTMLDVGWNLTSVWLHTGNYPTLRPPLLLEPNVIQPMGDGSWENPFQIAHLENLLWLSLNPEHWDKSFIQTADIDASESDQWHDGKGLASIGTDDNNAFSGYYNGQGYSINNLANIRPFDPQTGFFGFTQGATINNLHLNDAEIAGRYNAGVLVGESRASMVENCAVSGWVNTTYGTGGGLAGRSSGFSIPSIFSRCVASVQVYGATDSGGLIGNNDGNIVNSYATGPVNGSNMVGGLAGANSGLITHSFATGGVSGANSETTGGLVGVNSDTIMNSFWDTETSGLLESDGGEGKTSTEMKTLATFENSNWDFDYMWAIDVVENNGYPHIQIPAIPSAVAPAIGDGSAQNPYQISTLQHLVWLSESREAWSANYIQTADIDAATSETWNNGEGLSIIGNELSNTSYTDNYSSPFSGTYNGQEYSIENLFINKPGHNNVALFGFTFRSIIQNMNLVNASISGNDYTGALAGKGISLSIQNCHTSGVVNGRDVVGGLAGFLDQNSSYPYYFSNISNASSATDILGRNKVGGAIGIHGENSATINTYARGTVEGNQEVGGFAGSNLSGSDIEFCYATGSVTGNETIGGFAGTNSGLVENCFFDTETSGQTQSAGGTGKTTLEMTTQATYTDAGWSFDYIWQITAENENYPSFLDESIIPPGNGTLANPYQISTIDHLYWMSSGNRSWKDTHLIQTADIDAGATSSWNDGKGYRPVGHNSLTYNGQGHTISNLYINRPDENSVGFFSNGHVSNLGIIDAEVTGGLYVGAIVGYGSAKLSYATGMVTGDRRVGGAIGNGSTIYCYSHCNVTGNDYTGGLIGYSSGVKHSYATGHLESEGSNTGGLVGAQGGDPGSFWDITTSGQTQSSAGTGLTTADLQQAETYTLAGWDFDNLWDIDPAINSGYPFIREYNLPTALAPSSGDGSESSPYQIETPENLAWLSQNPGYWDRNFVQGNFIDASATVNWNYGEGFSPIGNSIVPFSGSYNGEGFALEGLFVKRYNTDFIGLFGLTSDASLEKIEVTDFNFTARNNVGGIVGQADETTISESLATGTMEANASVGGLVGLLNFYSELHQSYADVSISATDQVGGLVGYAYDRASISNCYAGGDVQGNSRVGGLIGYHYHYASLINSYSSTAISGNTATGGLVGETNATSEITDSFWDTDISGQDESAGGEGKTTPEMIDMATFSQWDFTSIWAIENETSYPYLQWQSTAGDHNYPPQQFSLTVNANPFQGGTPQGEGDYHEGGFVSLEAHVNDGYSFDYWETQGNGIISEEEDFTFLMPAEDITVTAVYTAIDYSLTVNVLPLESGMVELNPENEFYTVNDVITLTAKPAPGYQFVSWTNGAGDEVGVDEVLVYPMTAGDATLQANFAIIDYTLSVDVIPADAGSIGFTPEQDYYNIDDEVTLTANVNDGYKFIGWSDANDNLLNEELTFSYTMPDSNVIITANYEFFFNGGAGSETDPWTIATAEQLNNIRYLSDATHSDKFYEQIADIELGVSPWNDGEGWEPISRFYGTYNGGGFSVNGLLISRPIEASQGLFEHNSGLINGLSVTNANVSGAGNTGGLVGLNSGTLSGVSVTGVVNADDSRVGGIAGTNNGLIEESWSGADISGANDVGGLVGNNQGTISGSAASGDVSGEERVGGLLGYNYNSVGIVSNSYATGSVTGTSNVGGLVGQNNHQVSNSYSTGLVTGSMNVGGLIGSIFNTATNTYWDVQTSNQPSSGGTGVEGRTNSEMKDQVTFTDWDFSNVWTIVAGETYPFHQWQTEALDYNYPPDFHDLTLTSNYENGGELSGDGGYPEGRTAQIEATVNDGYEFINWTDETETVVSTDLSFTWTMPGQSKTFTANYNAVNYSFNAVSGNQDAGTIEVTPQQEYNIVGDEIQLTATAMTGYEFLNWSTQYGVASTEPNFTYIMPANNINMTANFGLIDYTISWEITPEGVGYISISPQKNFYNFGDVVTITANPEQGYSFESWFDANGIVVETNRVLEFSMPDSNIVLYAKYALIEYSIDVEATPSEGGTVRIEPDKESYHFGDLVTLIAEPNENYTFGAWKEGLATISNESSYSFTMPAWNIAYTGYFDVTTAISGTDGDAYNIFPNPASNILHVQSPETIKMVRIIDLGGQTLKTIEVNALQTEIDVSDLKTGSYFVRIETQNFTKTTLISIVR